MAVDSYKTKKGIRYRYRFMYENVPQQKGDFTTAKEAKHAEAVKLNKLKYHGTSDIYFNNLVDDYLNDIVNYIKESTYITKLNIIGKHIKPLFTDMPISEVRPIDIRNWQGKIKNKINPLTNKPYADTYLKTIQNQLSAIFNYAVKFYDLPENPVPIAGSLGKKNRDTFEFWTLAEFKKYISVVDDEQSLLLVFILFYSGMRIGEAIGLTWKNIDFENNIIDVKTTKQRINGRWVVTTPKTKKSIRPIAMPAVAMAMLAQWKKMQYKPKKTDFVFITDRTVVAKHITKYSKKSEVKRIRVQDLRHSHASLLVELGVNIIEISERLGHEKVQTTIDTYIHLYPNKQKEIAKKLELI